MKARITCLMTFALAASAYAGFLDDFDNEPADPFWPDDYGVFGGGTLDSGVTTEFSVSPPQSAYVAVDFDGTNFGFRTILLHNVLVTPIDLSGATLSVELSADKDLSGSSPGHVAFHLYDGDGSEWKTADADLFAPSTNFTEFSQNVFDLTQQVETGTVAGLDLTNITQYALDFYDQPGVADTAVVFRVDDFRGFFEISITEAVITNVTAVQFTSSPGVSYELEFTENLTTTNWNSAGFTVLGDGSLLNAYDPTGFSTSKSYRVIRP